MPRFGDLQVARGLLFSGLGDSNPAGIEAQVVNHIRYILSLEYGHSQQAPNGMLRTNMGRLENAARVFMQRHLAENPDNPGRALELAVAEAAQFALKVLVEATPVDTGAAKREWRVIGPRARGRSEAPSAGS